MYEGTHDTESHEKLNDCDDRHEPEGTLFTQGVIVDLDSDR